MQQLASLMLFQNMDTHPPHPWEELLNIFCLSAAPLKTGLLWLDRTCHSTFSMKKPSFDEFLIYLVSSVPKDDSGLNLILESQLSQYPSKLQSLLLQFLQLNINFFTKKCVVKVLHHIAQYHNTCEVTNKLFELLQSKFYADCAPAFLVFSENTEVLMTKKRHGSPSSQEFPASKKARIDNAKQANSSADTDQIQKLCTSANNQEFEEVILMLKTPKLPLSKEAYDLLLNRSVEEDFVAKVGLHMIKEASCDNSQVIYFLDTLGHVYLRGLKKAAGRQIIHMFIQIAKDYPDILINFLFLFGRNVAMNAFQSSFFVNFSKQTLSKQQQSTLFGEILENKRLTVSDLDVAISTYLSFVNLKVSINEQSVQRLCQFFENYSKSASKSFNFAKLLLSFLKNNKSQFSSENLQLLKRVVSDNDTSLKSACTMLLAKMEK